MCSNIRMSGSVILVIMNKINQLIQSSIGERSFVSSAIYIYIFFFKTTFKHDVCPKSYKGSPRGLTSSIHAFYYRGKTVKRAYKSQSKKKKNNSELDSEIGFVVILSVFSCYIYIYSLYMR